MPTPPRAPSASLDELGIPKEATLPEGATYAAGTPRGSVDFHRSQDFHKEVAALLPDPTLQAHLRHPRPAPAPPPALPA